MTKDMLGKRVRVGNTVVYPVQTREGLVLSKAVVAWVGKDELVLRTERGNGYKYVFSFQRLDRLAVVEV